MALADALIPSEMMKRFVSCVAHIAREGYSLPKAYVDSIVAKLEVLGCHAGGTNACAISPACSVLRRG